MGVPSISNVVRKQEIQYQTIKKERERERERERDAVL